MVTKDWVIISTERARRPEEFRQTGDRTADILPAYDPKCPFCPGNEHMSEEVMRVPSEDGGWRLRVVKNRFPALVPKGERVREVDGLRRRLTGIGHHEVLIESPIHNTCPALETEEEMVTVLDTFQSRGRALREDPRLEHIIYFKNHGVRAGSSLPHPHGQLISLPVVPHNTRARNDEARRYFDDHGTCVVCEMLDAERSSGERIIAENEHFVALIPYAAYSPFHMWILPKIHRSSFLEAPAAELQDLGALMRNVLRRLYFGLGDPDYNYVIRSAPLRDDRSAHQHWYVSVVPRVSQAAGFELGTGMFINSALPETSAAFMRDTDPQL